MDIQHCRKVSEKYTCIIIIVYYAIIMQLENMHEKIFIVAYTQSGQPRSAHRCQWQKKCWNRNNFETMLKQRHFDRNESTTSKQLDTSHCNLEAHRTPVTLASQSNIWMHNCRYLTLGGVARNLFWRGIIVSWLIQRSNFNTRKHPGNLRITYKVNTL